MKRYWMKYLCGLGHLHRSGASAGKCAKPVKLVRVAKPDDDIPA